MLTSRARRALGVVRPLVPKKAPNRCMGQLQGPALRREPMRRATRHPLPHALAAELACKVHGKVLSSKRQRVDEFRHNPDEPECERVA